MIIHIYYQLYFLYLNQYSYHHYINLNKHIYHLLYYNILNRNDLHKLMFKDLLILQFLHSNMIIHMYFNYYDMVKNYYISYDSYDLQHINLIRSRNNYLHISYISQYMNHNHNIQQLYHNLLISMLVNHLLHCNKFHFSNSYYMNYYL